MKCYLSPGLVEVSDEECVIVGGSAGPELFLRVPHLQKKKARTLKGSKKQNKTGEGRESSFDTRSLYDTHLANTSFDEIPISQRQRIFGFAQKQIIRMCVHLKIHLQRK